MYFQIKGGVFMGFMKRSGLRLLVLSGFVLLSLFLLGGCNKATQTSASVKNINITYVKSPLNVPSIVEKKQQLFEKEFGKDGIGLKFPEITSGAKQTEALASGDLDFCNALGGTSVILAASNGVDVKIVSMYSRAPKAFMILAKSPDIKSISDLKGKKVGGPKGTVLHQLLLAALDKNNLKPGDVQFVSLDIPSAVAALQNGSIDAALAAGADANRTIASGARVLTDGDGLIEGMSVVGVRGDFLKNHPDLVKRFEKVQQESLDFMKQNPDAANQLCADELGISVADVKQMLSWYDFDPQIRPDDIQDLQATQDFLYNNGMMTKKIDIQDLIAKS